jgi:putative ABC transport system permease protein
MLDVGYESKDLIILYFNDKYEYDLLMDKVYNQSDIKAFTGTNDHLGASYEDTFLVLDSGNLEIRSYRVGDEYLNMMGVELLTGRLFHKDNTIDLEEAVIVNEEYINKFGIEEPIGAMVNLKEGKRFIIGVVKNIVRDIFANSTGTVPEVFIPVAEEEYQMLIVKANEDRKQDVFNYLENSWKSVIPNRPFSANFQEDIAYGYAMQDNNNMKQIFFALAILGGILSLTGIFALSSLNVARRFKEIGIRKVLGASSHRILIQLNTGFFWTLVFASLAGAILGYVVTDQILSIIYTYHVPVGFLTLIVGSFSVLIVALITTSLTILSAANTNPAYILRDE